jgi:hypothetical protein
MKKKHAKRPGLPILVKYLKGETVDMPQWTRAIEGDPENRAAVTTLRMLQGMFHRLEWDKTIAASRQVAAGIFAGVRTRQRAKSRRHAVLYYDSRIVPLPDGIRPSLMSERRLRYHTDAGNIELSISPVFPGRFQITGRLDGDIAGRIDAVHLHGRKSYQTVTDEYGFFCFSTVNPGGYALHFKLEGNGIVIPNLTLR